MTIASLTVRYPSATVDQFIEHHAPDVGRHGIYIRTKRPFAVGTFVEFEVRIAGNQVVMAGAGRVVWRRDAAQATAERSAGVGVRFVEIDEPSRTFVERLLLESPGAGARYEAEVETSRAASAPSRGGSPSARQAARSSPGGHSPRSAAPSRALHGALPPVAAPPRRSIAPAAAARNEYEGEPEEADDPTQMGAMPAMPKGRKATLVGIVAPPALRAAAAPLPPLRPPPSRPSAPISVDAIDAVDEPTMIVREDHLPDRTLLEPRPPSFEPEEAIAEGARSPVKAGDRAAAPVAEPPEAPRAPVLPPVEPIPSPVDPMEPAAARLPYEPLDVPPFKVDPGETQRIRRRRPRRKPALVLVTGSVVLACVGLLIAAVHGRGAAPAAGAPAVGPSVARAIEPPPALAPSATPVAAPAVVAPGTPAGTAEPRLEATDEAETEAPLPSAPAPVHALRSRSEPGGRVSAPRSAAIAPPVEPAPPPSASTPRPKTQAAPSASAASAAHEPPAPPAANAPAPAPPPSAPAAEAPPRPNCNPTYTFDSEGNKHFKPECFAR